jgi:hypothetical protein
MKLFRRRGWKRWLLLGLLPVVVGLAIEDYRWREAEEQVRRELTAELDETYPDGWRLEQLQAKLPPLPPASENLALQLPALAKELPGWPDKAVQDTKEQLDQQSPTVRPSAEQLRQIRSALQTAKPQRDRFRPLVEPRPGRYPIQWTPDGITTLFPHAQQVRLVATMMELEAIDRSEAADPAGTAAACRIGLNTAAFLRHDPCMILQLVRIAVAARVGRCAERALAQGEWTPEQLAGLQRLVEEDESSAPLPTALQGELAVQFRIYESVATGQVKSFRELDVNKGSSTPWEDMNMWLYRRYQLRSTQAKAVRYMEQVLAVSALPSEEQHEQYLALGDNIQADAKSDSISTRIATLMIPDWVRFHEACLRFHTHQRCLATALAAERFRLGKGRWPKDLGELTPEYLARVPTDPRTGQPLKLHRSDDGLVIYGVGPDKQDNGGVIDRTKPIAPGTDLGYQLWDVKHRRQPPPPPTPALPPPDEDPAP